MNTAASLVICYVLAVIIGVIGWIMNVVALIHMATAHAPVDAMFIARIVGVPFAVLGAVLGWF